MSDKMREEFEVWYLGKFCGGTERLKRCHNMQDIYYFTGVQSIWIAWLASREALVIDLPTATSERNNEVIKAVGRHIAGQGLKVNL